VSSTPRRRSEDELADAVRRHRRRRKSRRRRTGTLLLALAILVPGALVAAGFTATAAFRSSCSLSSLEPVTIGQNSFVYAADGSLLGSIPAERNREPVQLHEVSPWMRRATIAIEDRRFYRHGGVDYVGITRALWRDLTAGKIVQGGSTLTQQLVRNLYISRERTFQRKLKEACLAIKLSRHWPKDRILQEWLNQVYFGNHAYGVEAAAQTYFSKHARDLTPAEAALLAGLPQAPSVYDPFRDQQAALDRRDGVLRAMLETGDIGLVRYETIVADRNLHLRPGRLYTRIREPYFFGYVRDELIRVYGVSTVHSGGLRVYTTIDPRFQRLARRAIRRTLYSRDDPAAALVAINPANGAIRAMDAVTPGRAGNQFNLAAQARRQAGSTFKTFALTAAVAQGMDPDSTYYTSGPFTYQPDPAAEAWQVSTYDHSYAGTISVRSATLRSDNTVYAQLTLDAGPERVAGMAHKLGVVSPLQPVPSIGLGSNAVSPLDMASAYATLAAGGIYSKPRAIRRVVLPDGKEDVGAGWGTTEQRRVIPDWVAAEVTDILGDNMRYGTGVGAYFGRPSAGKTGTTDDHTDAWFCGFTPDLATAVWIGYPAGEIPMESVHGISVSGPTFPADVWHLFMQSALWYSPPKDFPEPRQEPRFGGFVQRHEGYVAYAQPPAQPETDTTEETTPQATGPASTTPADRPAAPTAPAPAGQPPAETAPVPPPQHSLPEP
jgi:penicillin-binding protein 1A